MNQNGSTEPPPSTCLNIQQIFQSPANRIALSHELRHAARLTEEDWVREGGLKYQIKTVAEVLFPFILTCLTVGTALNVKEDYLARVHVLPFDTSFDEGDNDDGITVLDITDLERVRYCFVNIVPMYSENEYDGDGTQETRVLPPSMTPLTGPQYLSGYYKATPENQEAFGDLVKSFETLPLIDCRDLYSAWPNHSWVIMVAHDEELEQLHVDEIIAEEERSGNNDEVKVEASEIPSLRQSSLAKVLKSAIDSPSSELPRIIEFASLLSDFYPTAKSKLYANPTVVSTSASARRLLNTIFKKESTIDLGPFDLTTEQILEVLEEVSNNPRDVVSLSFSGNLNITEEFLRGILIKFSRLEFLYLLNTPQIPLTKKIELLRGTATQLYDTELLALPFVEREDERLYERKFDLRESPLYGYIKPIISQMIVMACSFTSNDKRDTDGGLNIESFFKDGVMNNYNHDYACTPFVEANLPSSALIAGLAQCINYLIHQQPYLSMGMMDPLALNVAMHLAIPHACAQDNENAMRVGTISEYFYRTPIDSRSLSHVGGWWKKQLKVVPGDWTLIAIGETAPSDRPREERATVRYAFITAAPPTDAEDATSDSYIPKLVIKDICGFLDSAIPDTSVRQKILEDWNKAIVPVAPDVPLKLSGKQEVESLMRAIRCPVGETSKLDGSDADSRD
ncbi:hypothetical protein SBOR_1019 [Sclerotinia borealis F-4128]|uniref:Uncharacterized protein n=1 Tax=Sclerotinia borealis (strain F-4128) TaxID=1432307 RepID=W9CVD2_SCLBF|nr:hypothetical protein SBOR_1019 [Sclerotinia borealis F-4128]